MQLHEALKAKSFHVENFCRDKLPLTFASDSHSPTSRQRMALQKWGMWYTAQLCTRHEFVSVGNERRKFLFMFPRISSGNCPEVVAGAGDCTLGQHLISFVTGLLYLLFYIHLNFAEGQLLGFFPFTVGTSQMHMLHFWGISISIRHRGWHQIPQQAGTISIQEGHTTRANTAAPNQAYMC